MNVRSIWRPNGDATLTTSCPPRPTLTPPRIQTSPIRCRDSTPLAPDHASRPTLQHADRLAGLVVAAALAASIALALAGCSTPVVKPSSTCRANFAASTASDDGARGRLVGKLTTTRCCPIWCAARRMRTATSRLPPSACAPRAPARRSAAPSLLPSVGAVGSRQRSQQRLQRAVQAGRSGHQERQRRPRRLVGNRPERTPAGRCSGRSRGRHAGRGAQRARRAPAGDDRCRDQLLHAGRRAAPARNAARDLGGS